ncbi:MAG: tRNA (adenosine(37)-N6)-threonylcarbamoyltransferase complex dimerization subunit type 1 TsaB [Candidatus Saganbacteria bacterium]|nr:tRNA (adenosine(37)-N6)-threonylcarbamoyltransferase complex dimerization subunit type 1 TsaB [Candidatus Saganbacteria bacterium]
MRILGISSATKVISIGLIENEKVLFETTVAEMRAEKIIFYVKEAKILPEQIDGVSVAQGPGSYSGLRGGLATAKSLAQTLKIPLVGVSTLSAIAYNLIDVSGTIAVVLDAKRDDYNFALFSVGKGKLNRLTDDLVCTLDGIREKISKLSGEVHLISKLDSRRIGLQNSDSFHFTEELHSHPYGINVARLGLIKIKAGEIVDPLKLVPRYSHTPNIREYKS